MARTIDSLKKFLDKSPDPHPLPRALPLAHLSIAKWFRQIAESGYISPRHCDVFGKDLLYFFYGGVFYRSANGTTRDESACPVAFVFSPNVLSQIVRAFPFDTGALASNKYGSWKTKLLPFERFGIETNGQAQPIQKVVECVFGDNLNYVDGNHRTDLKVRPRPLPTLSKFYSADLTAAGVDQRQMVIECLSEEAVSFKDDLLWVGFPESFTAEFVKICEWMSPIVPDYYAYRSHIVKAPGEIAYSLEIEARKALIDRYLKF